MSRTIEIEVLGMTCDGCRASVDKAVRRVAGVVDVTVDRPGQRATVVADTAAPDALVAAIEAAGYDARVEAVR